MAISIRKVCGSCLQSVEISDCRESYLPVICPYCGIVIEASGVADSQDRTEEFVSSRPPYQNSDAPTPCVEPAKDPRIGLIGRFELLRELGDGGYGSVYLAREFGIRREVALKVLKEAKSDSKSLERFFREAQLAADLDHSNIVTVFASGRDDGKCWISYRYVRGKTLATLRDERSLDVDQAARIIRELCDALAYAHERGVIHRDIKPSNVIVDEKGKPNLTDFGLARRIEDQSELTGERTVLGSHDYMAPEQAMGQARSADGRSDLYSLGLVFNELIRGRGQAAPTSPHSHTKSRSSLVRSTTASATGPSSPYDKVIMKAVRSDPRDRYQTAGEMRSAIDRILRRRARSASVSIARVVAVSIAIGAVLLAAGAWSLSRGPAESTARPVPPKAAAKVPAPLPARYVGNVSSRMLHRPTCSSARRLLEKNRVEFANISRAREEGYVACQSCHPD